MLENTLPALLIFAALLCLPAGCTQAECKTSPDRAAAETAEHVETIEEHWPNGELRLRKQVVKTADGTLVDHGAYARWYDNGQQEYETTFVHGKKDGVATRWHKNGRKWLEEHYQHGQKHGVTRAWDENGVLRKEERHANGKPHGVWTIWDKRGRIRWQQRYLHGTAQP
jgi:antitoxin component YwqK of YwqJK toxin-antitoxin module